MPPTGQARGTKRAALGHPICARAARLEGQQNRRSSQWSRQAGGTKRGLYAPNLRTCSHAQRTGISLYHYHIVSL